MSVQRKIRIWTVLYILLLASFTCYVLLDAFVIQRSYLVVEDVPTMPPEEFIALSETPQSPTAMPSQADETAHVTLPPSTPTQPIITETSYSDDRLTIQLSTYRRYDSDIHVAEVKLTDISHLKTAFAENTYGRNITEQTSVMAREHAAILAINGDYYGSQRRGYVIRNGVLYRDSASDTGREALCLWPDGTFTLVEEGETRAAQLVEQGVLQAFSFGPTLVRESEVAVTSGEEVGQAMVSNPRTAIAMVAPLHYLFVVSDGRTETSRGLSLYELATVLQELGASTAYNLDGGGSSTMVFDGRVINFPTTRGGRYAERAVSDIVYIQ